MQGEIKFSILLLCKYTEVKSENVNYLLKKMLNGKENKKTNIIRENQTISWNPIFY